MYRSSSSPSCPHTSERRLVHGDDGVVGRSSDFKPDSRVVGGKVVRWKCLPAQVQPAGVQPLSTQPKQECAQPAFRLVLLCRRRSAARKMVPILDAFARRRRRKATKLCRRNGLACTPSTRRRAAGSSSPRHCWTVRLGWRLRLPWTRVHRQRRGGGLVRAAASNGLVRAACCPSQTLS